ncbi:MAG: ABC transporter permease [Cyclobacteriaceae bacterium]|nr:ABC transporter permease [Cyclobacteriaceae bacterium]
MITNYLRIALRNIRQNPVYALINIFSLAIGLASCVVIYLFVSDEKSFDAWHSQGESIYRVNEVQNFTGTNRQKVALTGGPFGPAMEAEFPEIKRFTRYWGSSKRVVKLDDKQILINKLATVDSTFLSMFDFPMLHGDPNTALDEPNTMVLTESTARKYFDDPADAIGKSLSKRGREYKVTGIVKDVPENSHLQFDLLESFETHVRLDSTVNTDWNGNYLVTYIQLQPNADASKLEAKFHDWFIKWTGEPDINESTSIYLQRFKDVHLESSDMDHDYQNYRKFNGAYLNIFLITGAFILLIAGVNFMNLATARASHRWKEIGVRTSVGARKKQLFSQFILESLVLAMVALVIALLLDFIFIPLLNQLIGRQLLLSNLFTDFTSIGAVLLITLVLGFLTGIYPSLYMTSFNAVQVLKGGAKTAGRSIFRSSLVIVQFGLAIGMIVSTGIVIQQLYFMKNTDVGFTTDQMLLVQMERESAKKYEVMKTDLQRNSHILGVTASGQRLGNNFHQWGYKVKSDTGVMQLAPSNVNVDYDYLKVYGIQLKDGRDFSREVPTDQGKAFIINEALVKHLGLKNPVGTQAGHGWHHNDSLGTIIGVVKDFNFNSLHHAVNTLSIVCHPDWGFDEMTIKIDGARVTETIEEIKAVWNSHVTEYPFTYTFLDQHMAELYRTEQQMSSVITIMAVLAVMISCMGLFGLVMITTERKIKEIGIRKALGATETEITVLISSQFAKLVAVAFVIISPVAYYFLSGWLETFAYRVNINPLIFLAGGMAALAVAMITIGYHTLRSARANPVKALRYE